MEKPILQDSPSFVDLCTLHQHAMRYYRLWIYACNTVLALATLVFTVFAVSVLVDPRISLLSGVELYQPTFLYAYVALLLQCGVLQAIGCVGALRLNQRLLNTYWTLLLVLMIGDILVGLVWAFRLDHIKSNLRPMLKQKLVSFYGKDQDFTEVWDWVQEHDMCCGVDGPIDFQRINESTFGTFEANGLANDTWASYLLHQQERLQQQQSIPKLPSTCCIFTVTPITTPDPPPPSSSESGGGTSGGRRGHHNHNKNRSGNSQGKGWSANDPANPKQLQGGYYQQPQYLKGSFQNSAPFPEMTNGSGGFSSNSIVASSLRQYPLTDPVSAVAPGYFSPGVVVPPQASIPGPGTHNRRKISHAKNKHLDEVGFVDRNRWGGGRPPVSTTEGPPAGRPSPATIGVCVLPVHLKQTPSPSSSSFASSSMESGSFEDGLISSSEQFSSTALPPSSQTTKTTTESSGVFSSSTDSTRSPSSKPAPTSQSNFKKKPTPNRPHNSYPFTVSMEQHGIGCGDKILEWVEHSSDVLFVIGFCIIVFLKGCFIAILRYEIKEMIEKIKLLNGEDAGRTAAMNELIGLTSMYESGNEDSGEREGLMSGVHGTNADTSNTNVDTIEGDNGATGAVPVTRKDSIHYLTENHIIGNNVTGPPPRYIGNHVGSHPTNDDYPRVLAVTRDSIPSPGNNKHDIEEDFDSGSALLGYKHIDSPIGNSKYHLQYPHRNENGGRSLPRNGNNNNAVSIENSPVSVPTSASAPLPIDAIARVTNTSIH